MKITLRNENKNMEVSFLGGDEIRSLYGYEYTLTSTQWYVNLTNSLNLFESCDYAGFYRNRQPDNYTVQAIATDGDTWKGNRLNSNVISWKFYPQIIEDNSKYGVSPHQYLNTLLEIDDEILVMVNTGTSKTFSCYHYVLDTTDTEAGIIALSTSRNGKGIYWKTDDFVRYSYYFGMGSIPKIPLTHPQIHLSGSDILPPFHEEFFANTEVSPVIKLGYGNTGDVWNKFEYTNETTGQSFIYTNNNNDKTIVIDNENQTVTNSSGVDRSANFSGDFITFTGGVNNVVWNVDDGNNEYLPQDVHVTVQYEILESTISN